MIQESHNSKAHGAAATSYYSQYESAPNYSDRRKYVGCRGAPNSEVVCFRLLDCVQD